MAVVGHVGCGKSSLLSAILGEMQKVSGRVNMKVESLASFNRLTLTRKKTHTCPRNIVERRMQQIDNFYYMYKYSFHFTALTYFTVMYFT